MNAGVHRAVGWFGGVAVRAGFARRTDSPDRRADEPKYELIIKAAKALDLGRASDPARTREWVIE